MPGLSIAARSLILNARGIPSFEFGGKFDRLEPTPEALEGMLALVEHGVFEVETANRKAGSIRLVRSTGRIPKSELTYDGRPLHSLLETQPYSFWRMREKGEAPLTVRKFRELLEERTEEKVAAPAP